jgi:hypothetical protein
MATISGMRYALFRFDWLAERARVIQENVVRSGAMVRYARVV